MTTPVNTRDSRLQSTTPRVLGVSTNYITLNSPSLQFKYGSDNVAQPSQVIVTASLVGLLSGTVTFTYTGLTTATVNPSNSNQLIINPENFTGDFATINASLSFQGQTYQAVPISISKVYNQLVAKTTRALDLLPSYADGSGYTLPSAVNYVELYNGVVKLASGVVYGPATQTVNGLTFAVNTSTGLITLSQAAVNTWTGNSESVTFTATKNNIVYNTTYTITKAKAGVGGQQEADLELYQWSVTQPALPTGTSTFTWTTKAHVYNGTDQWKLTVPNNPGTLGIALWRISKNVRAEASVVNLQISTTWATASTIQKITTEANTYLKTYTAKVYKNDTSIPTILGTNTLTWSSFAYAAPSGWSLTPPAADSGLVLYTAEVFVQASQLEVTSTIDWTQAAIRPISYYGTDGASARRAYVVVTGTPSGTPATFTATGDALPTAGTWFANKTWTSTAPSTALAAGEFVYQSDGVYVMDGNTTWGYPYLSNLKVGSLSAITTNTGDLNVSGSIKGGSATAINAGTGYYLTSDGKFRAGVADGNRIEWNGTSLAIYNSANTAILTTGGVLSWAAVGGTGRPADGATRNVFRGDYSAATAYALGDIVIYNGNGWSCIAATTGNAPPTSNATSSNTYWSLYAVRGIDGKVGVDGVRGSVTAYLSGYTAWSDAAANTYFTNTYGGKVLNDVVTEYGTNFSQTKFWNGSAWTTITVAIDGSLLVTGTVAAGAISTTNAFIGHKLQSTDGNFVIDFANKTISISV